MANVVTITRGLQVESNPLVSAFTQQSIEFTVVWDGTVGTPSVSVGGYDFTPIRTLVVGYVCTYYLDLTDVLKYLLSYPPESVTVTGLTLDITIVCTAGAITSSETDTVTFAVNKIGSSTKLFNVWKYGHDDVIYHNGVLCFYFADIAGTYEVIIGGTSYSYTLVKGYNLLTLNATHLKSGHLEIAGTTVAFSVVYSSFTGSEITWLDENGCWSSWNFRKLNEVSESKESNEVALYYDTNVLTKAKTMNNSRAVTKTISFDTVAVDTTHYAQLVKIASSPRVIYDGQMWAVSSSSTSVAECRQNLNFKLSLKAEQNGVSY